MYTLNLQMKAQLAQDAKRGVSEYSKASARVDTCSLARVDTAGKPEQRPRSVEISAVLCIMVAGVGSVGGQFIKMDCARMRCESSMTTSGFLCAWTCKSLSGYVWGYFTIRGFR